MVAQLVSFVSYTIIVTKIINIPVATDLKYFQYVTLQ